jgi:predicted Zn-dependent protease
VQPDQFATLHRAMNEVKETLDFHDDVPVFVSQAPWFNAGAYGVEKPFIVVNSATLDLLDERELRVLLAHELGHVMSGHALYHTMLMLILAFGIRNLPFLAGIALVPIRLGLQEWSRKSELSADRAGLLGSQDPDAALSMFLKAAGGSVTTKHELNAKAYERQIEEYEQNEGADTVFKFLNLLDRSHPFHTLRAAELNRWRAGADYAKILAGDYRRRSEHPTASYGSDLNEAASYYAGEARERAREVTEMAKSIAQETASYAKRAASEASDKARAAAERLGEALRRRGD